MTVKFFRESAVQKGMKITILQFSGENEMDDIIHLGLKSANIRVKRVKNLTELHINAGSGLFDAVLVSETSLADYHMDPSHHQQRNGALVSILAWGHASNNRLKVTNYPAQASSGNLEDQVERDDKLDFVRKVIERLPTAPESLHEGFTPYMALGGTRTHDGAYEIPDFPIEMETRLHRKVRQIIALLSMAGNSGISVAQINEALWRNTDRNRKRDVQIYISRIRSLLAEAFPDRYRITLEKNRYFLRERAS